MKYTKDELGQVIQVETFADICKEVGLPALGVVTDDAEALRLATLSSGGTLRTLKDEFMREGSFEIKDFNNKKENKK